jgi:hypothetical protein
MVSSTQVVVILRIEGIRQLARFAMVGIAPQAIDTHDAGMQACVLSADHFHAT